MPTFASVTRSAARLRQATWMEQIQQAYLIFIGASFLMFLLPGGVKHLLRPLYLVLPLLPLVAKDLAHLPDVVARFRAAYAARAWGHGRVPLDAIDACERLAEAPEAWLRRHGIERSRAVRVSASPFDKPNTVLMLKAESCVRLNHMGVERGEMFSIFLCLDKPQDLVRALSAH